MDCLRQLVSGVLSGLVLVLAGCVGVHPWLVPPTRTTLAADRIELPTKLEGGRLYVEARVNGAGPYWFLVDTGAWGLVVAPHVLIEAGLTTSANRSAQVVDAHGNGWKAQSARVARLQMPGFEIEGLHAVVQTDEQRTRANSPITDGGVLGMRVFLDVALALDFERNVVSVSKPGALELKEDESIPYEEICPIVTVNIGATPVRILVDTGSNEALTLATLRDWPLLYAPLKADGYSLAVGGYRRPMFSQLRDDVQIGPITHRNLIVSSSGPGSNAVGAEFFRRWRLVLNQQRRLLWILGPPFIAVSEFQSSLDSEGRPKMWGFFWVPEGKSLRIREVDAGTRAEKLGFRAGDLVVAIEGETPADYWSRNSIASTQRWRIQRDHDELEIVLSAEALNTDS